MFNAKTFAKYVGISVACFFLSGCMNMERPEDRAIVATLGTVAAISIVGAFIAPSPNSINLSGARTVRIVAS